MDPQKIKQAKEAIDRFITQFNKKYGNPQNGEIYQLSRQLFSHLRKLKHFRFSFKCGINCPYMEEMIVIAVCLCLNALFAAYEMAFVSVPKPELRSVARKGNNSAKKLLKLRDNPERTLSVIQVGITLVGAIAAAVGGAGASDRLEPYLINQYGLKVLHAEILAVLAVVLPITYLNVVIGELVPKTLALRNPLKIVMAGSQALFVADKFLSPVVTTLEWSTKKILNIFFRKKLAQEPSQLSTIEIDALSPTHQTLMLNLAQIENKKLTDALVPWSKTNFVRKQDSIADVLQAVFQSGHTRLPVVDDNKIIGVLHTKEFITYRESGETDWNSIVRPPMHVHGSDSVLRTMRLMQDKKIHMAMVINEAQYILGIVTLEDLIEEVIGDIYDEDDDGKIRKIYAAKAKGRFIK